MSKRTAAAPRDPWLEHLASRCNALARAGKPAWAHFYRTALPILRAGEGRVQPLTVDAAGVLHARAAVRPALPEQALPFDIDALLALLRELRAAFQPAPKRTGWLNLGAKRDAEPPAPMLPGLAEALAALDTDAATLEADLAALLAAEPVPAVARAGAHGDLAALLLEMLTWPGFRVWASQLPPVEPGTWPSAACPTCGSLATFSETAGREGARMLRCRVCGGGWPFARLSCRACGNGDSRQLTRLSLEREEEKYFVQACDACGSYDKFINNADPHDVYVLAVEDALSAHYDDIAAERGYHRPRAAAVLEEEA